MSASSIGIIAPGGDPRSLPELSSTTILVEDMHCAACTGKISAALDAMAGIERLRFNPVRRQVMITHTDQVRSDDLLKVIQSLGFHPQLRAQDAFTASDATLLKRLGIAGIGMMQVMMIHIALYAGAFQGMDANIERALTLTALLFCIPVVTYSAVPFFISGLASLRQGLNMDTPIALAITVAFTVSLVNTLDGNGDVYFDSVVMFTFLMLGARYLDQRIRNQLRLEDDLLANLPRQVMKFTQDGLQSQPLALTNPGDELWVGEGEQIPVDGTLLSQQAHLDEALLTGESEEQHRLCGAEMFAGTVNRGVGLRIRTNRIGDATRLAQIDALANLSLDSKHKLARLADKVAGYFIPTILLISLATWVGWSLAGAQNALSAALAVLVVSCPCALSLATPAALTAALVRLRRAGVLLKNPNILEKIDQVSDVYFDKTGTLTSPHPQLVKTILSGAFDQAFCLRAASALQMHAHHPLAKAFTHIAAQPAEAVELVTGKGIEGQVDGHHVKIGSAAFCGHRDTAKEQTPAGVKQIFLTIDQAPAACFHVAQTLRKDALPTIQAMQQLGIETHMLSGDQVEQCAIHAEALGMSYSAQAAPETKQAQLQHGHKGAVMFVGDGVNDLPALASADVSIATMETTDLVKSKADAVLLSDALETILALFKTGSAARRIMLQNLAWAVAYNLIAIPAAVLGMAPPWLAALGMSISSLIVMLNATRLLRTEEGAI